jgi:hypothetical protein
MNAESESKADASARDALVVAEFVGLRSEITKLIELQSQLVSLTVVTVGAVLGVAVQARSPSLAFVYPVLALILGITWLNHAHAISRCALYLSEEFEPRHGGGKLGWEAFVRRNPLRFGMLGYWGVRSVFMGSSVVALIIGWSLIRQQALLIVAGVFASVLSSGTIALFLLWREPSPLRLLAETKQTGAGE